jgi:hypothetical protein
MPLDIMGECSENHAISPDSLGEYSKKQVISMANFDVFCEKKAVSLDTLVNILDSKPFL